MTENQKATGDNLLVEYLEGRISRAQLFKAVGAGLALAAVPGMAAAAPDAGTGSAASISYPFFPQVPRGSYTTEQILDIFNVAITAEYLAVTILTTALTTYAAQLKLNAAATQVLQASLAEEQAHLDFLAAAGAKPMTTTFTLPAFTNPVQYFKIGEVFETIFTAAYMTAAREFAELGQPTLVKYAYQIGAVEAEHRALIRGILGLLYGVSSELPANNKAFETDLLLYTRDAVPIFAAFGLLGGSGTPTPYPGRAAALAAAAPTAAAVVQTTPNNATSSVTFNGDLSTIGTLIGPRT